MGIQGRSANFAVAVSCLQKMRNRNGFVLRISCLVETGPVGNGIVQ